MAILDFQGKNVKIYNQEKQKPRNCEIIQIRFIRDKIVSITQDFWIVEDFSKNLQVLRF